MTVLNVWSSNRSGDGAERGVVLQCDFCFPPRLAFGPPNSPLLREWEFDDFEAGPHRCSWCAELGGEGRGIREGGEGNPAAPNLVVIGAAKCGTSALHTYLGLHPEIFMSKLKELNFFQDPGCLQRLSLYSTWFDGDAPVRGESSPVYSCHPLLPGVPERIKEVAPDAKLIYLVRDPVERAIATYVEYAAQEIEGRSPEEAFRDPDDPYNVYTAQSRYLEQYERFTELFTRDQILVLEQDQLLSSRAQTMRRIFGFLGVDPDFASPDFARIVNPRSQKRRRSARGRWLRRSRLAGRIRSLPAPAREALLRPVRRLTSARVRVDSPDLRARLSASLDGELDALRARLAAGSGGTTAARGVG